MYALIYFLIFFLSLNPRLAIIPIIILFIISLIKWTQNFRYHLSKISKAEALLFCFYFLHIIGIIYSDNKENAYFDLEVKLSLIIFPFIFTCLPPPTSLNIKNIFRSFILGLSIGIIMGIINALGLYFNSGQTDHLYSSYFSYLIPSNYYGIYILTGLLMCLQIINEKHKASRFGYMFIICLSLGLILCSSRAAFLALFTILILIFIYVVLHKKNILISIITLGLFISLSIAVLTVPIRPFERFKAIYYELKEDNSPETLKSASIRYQVWSASWHSIKTNLYFGAGTGDVEKTLNKSYKKLNIKTATKRNLNTHNQFLQSWIALGLPGFLFLLSILLYPLITAYNRHDIYMAGIILSWGIFMLTESCLERQYGIILFTLLYLVLMKKTKHPI